MPSNGMNAVLTIAMSSLHFFFPLKEITIEVNAKVFGSLHIIFLNVKRIHKSALFPFNL